MIWLYVYIALALISFVIFTITSTLGIREANRMFEYPVYQLSLAKLIWMSVFFPFTWIKAIIEGIIGD